MHTKVKGRLTAAPWWSATPDEFEFQPTPIQPASMVQQGINARGTPEEDTGKKPTDSKQEALNS